MYENMNYPTYHKVEQGDMEEKMIQWRINEWLKYILTIE